MQWWFNKGYSDAMEWTTWTNSIER
jgi:hypothetical protein